MDTILDKKKYFCLPFVLVYYRLMLHGTIFLPLFVSGNCIGLYFGKMAQVIAIMDAVSLQFSEMDNSLLNAYGRSPVDKIEERITFAMSHARLYLSESDDEQYNKSAAANTFDISCGGWKI